MPTAWRYFPSSFWKSCISRGWSSPSRCSSTRAISCAGRSRRPGGRLPSRSTLWLTLPRATRRATLRCRGSWSPRWRWPSRRCLWWSFSGKLFAALHRERRELGLRLVAADDEHQQVLLARLVVGHVHEAARDADRERDHVEGVEVDVLHRLALVPLAAPLAGDRDEGLVGVVVVHQRALARLRLAVAEVEALGDRDRRHRGGVGADWGSGCRVVGHGRLKADHRVQLAAALGQRAVGQAAVGALQVLEARHALHHLFAAPVSNIFPVAHRISSLRYYRTREERDAQLSDAFHFSIAPRVRRAAARAPNRQRHRLPRRLQLADLGRSGEGAVREERPRCEADTDAELGVPAHQD